MYFSEKSFIFEWVLVDFRERQVKNLGLKGEMTHFSRAFKDKSFKLSLNGWEVLNYIFLD